MDSHPATTASRGVCRERLCGCCLFTLSVLLSGTSIILSLLTYKEASMGALYDMKDNGGRNCRPCNLASQSNVGCCAVEPKQLEELFKTAVEEARFRPFSGACSSGAICQPLKRLAAHVPLTMSEGKTQFISHPSDLRTLQDVTIRNNSLVIHTQGFYYVYSHVTLLDYHDTDTSGTDTSGVRETIAKHFVMRYNPAYPNGGREVLLKNSESRQMSGRHRYTEHSSFVGGVMYLRKHDEIYVTVSGTSGFADDRESSYVGMVFV